MSGIIFLMKNGSIVSSTDYTRWNNTKWYHKIIGYFFRRYKNKFLDPKPFRVFLKELAIERLK